jgi:glycosyl transferase family 25
MNNSTKLLIQSIQQKNDEIKEEIKEEINDNEVKFDFIEKVIYINLEKRKDRREQIEKELAIYFPPEKIVRFNAFYENVGPVGCTKSHIGALEMAIENKWENCLIVEDDIEWKKNDEFNNLYKKLKNILKNTYDVIVLNSYDSRTYNKTTYKLECCRSTGAYICNSSYYKTILDNFKESLALLIAYRIKVPLNINNKFSLYNIDEYWQKLQKKDKWYIVAPSICIQKSGYSDCIKGMANYRKNEF